MQFTTLLGRFERVTEESDGGYLALCPAHPDTRPSLRIWVGDDAKARFTCRSGCDTANVVASAGLRWSDMFGIEGAPVTVPAARPEPIGVSHVAALAQYVDNTSAALASSETAQEYAARRFGLTASLAADLMIGADTGDGVAGHFPYLSSAYTWFPRLTVPLCDFEGNPRGLQGRDLSGNCPSRWVGLSNPQGRRWAAYGVLRGQGAYGVTLVAEGPGDGLTAAALGYDAVFVRGASIAANPDLIAELAKGLRGQLVVVAGDDDAAGRKFNRLLSEGLSAAGITTHVLALPTEHGDITEWREAAPELFAAAFHKAVKAARPLASEAESLADVVTADLAERTGADVVTREQGLDAAGVLAGLIERYGDTDAMNAHALVAWTDGRIRYAAGLGFYVWNGRVWESSSTKVRQEIHRMGAALMLAGKTKEARPFAMTTRINDMTTELRSVPSVHVSAADFDARPDLLSFRNGTVELRTGKLRQHAKEDMLTYCLDIDYVPSATAPRWEAFMAEIMPGMPDMVDYLQRLTGYGITGCTSEQCFAVLWGKGANGKSVFTDTLTGVFRQIVKTTPFATFEEKTNGGIPNDIAALRGSRLVMASEGESGKPMSEAVLKRTTGTDMISARFLQKEFFEFKPSFLLCLATNHKPKFRGQDEGLWRRVKMIPFTRWFAPHERDHGLPAKLLAESEGIAAWAVRGAVAWYASGLGDPATVTDAVTEYRETSDALAGFFPGVLVRDDDAQMAGGDAYNAYRDWCEAEGLPQKEVTSRTKFYEALSERGITKKKTNKGVGLVGIRLADTPAAPTGPGIFSA